MNIQAAVDKHMGGGGGGGGGVGGSSHHRETWSVYCDDKQGGLSRSAGLCGNLR